MSLSKYIKLEFIKIKNSNIKYIVILPIILSTSMIISDIILRKNIILSKYNPIINDGFQSLLVENHLALIWPIILMFSIIINSICIFYIDLKNNSLTHILSCLGSRSKYYLSKLITILIVGVISILLEGIVLIILGYLFKLSPNIDVPLVIRYMWMQLFALLALIALQVFLFSLTRDAMFLTTINIVAICVSIIVIRYSSINVFIPYLQISNSMSLTVQGSTILKSMLFSSIEFILFTSLGLIIFNRIDIKGE
ncbi:ABC-2 type transport system permease protein [Clostridium cavendishii DSM 21758]|uniref:ABC-2 type transport system permease protein n=1 Tax=Clostridium cavendishii DSM 21758 TaxID=1121302 RepID=A0A1M6ITN3_9CLOT|nr:hypothetical protein [Clostridium cavendishii]SHJ37840.1 ABC-2 type transport system permease protein [Clostridium cavendishii DSM 21758]